MRAALLLALPLVAHAGLLDKLRGVPSPNVAVDAPPPSPPADPSTINLDHAAFGGGAGAAAPSQAGGAVKTAGSATTMPGQTATTALPIAEEPYEGVEYRFKALRFRPAEFKAEGVAFLLVGFFALVSVLGKRSNKEQAVAWWRAHIDILNAEFSSFLTIPSSASLTRVDPNTYVGYASGRRGTTGLTVTITTTPRQDIFQRVYLLGQRLYDLTWVPTSNSVQLSFELPDSNRAEDFVFGVVRKDQMMQVKEARWDLSAFASTVVERADVLKGNDFVVFSEGGQLNDFFLKREKVGIKELFDSETGRQALKYLGGLIISDIVEKRPEESTLEKAGAVPKSRKLTLTFALPPYGRQEETRPLLELALNLLDVLDKGGVPTETLNKTKKRRVEIYNLLTQEVRKEAADKKIADARALKRKAEEERREKMPLNERRKAEQKEREKEAYRQAKKQQQKK